MAAVAFDSLHHARQLEAAGMPREQAELVAQGLTAMFVHNFDALVTKDYLDTRFSEQSVRMDLLAAEIDGKLNLLSADTDGKLGKLYVMFGVIMAGLSIPIIQTLVTWLS
jgi:hypothetical protein